MANRLVTQSMTSHDLVKRRLYRKRDGIGQTPCSYERYLVIIIINVWNSLPGTVTFVSLNALKRSIVTVDFSNFLKCFYLVYFISAAVSVSFSSLAVRLTAFMCSCNCIHEQIND